MPKTTTIIHIVEAFGGGVFQSLRQLCNSMPDVDILIVHDYRTETPENFAEHFNKNVRFKHVKMGRSINPKKDWGAILKIREIVKEEKPVAVHAHSSKAGALARLAFLGKGLPVFYSPHSYAFLMQDSSLTKKYAYILIEWLLGRFNSTTVACGYDELKIAKKVSRKAITIPNAFDIKNVSKKHRTRPVWDNKTPLRIISNGRIIPQKNFGLLCDVARELSSKPVEFLWIGGGDTEKFDVPPNVTITGWISHDEVMEQLRTGNVFMSLSLWEGLPLSLLEAMAHGFPLIATDVIGNHELLANNNGFLCNSGKDAINAIEEILSNPEKLEEMGKNSYQLLNEKYNWEKNIEEWKKVYSTK